MIAYRNGRGVVDEIEARIDDLARPYQRVHPMGREEVQQRVDECQQPLREAKAPMMALGMDLERTEKAAKDAEQSPQLLQIAGSIRR